MVARNPAQVNRLLGGSPPGVPPANAFDMDPAELDRMLSEGWTMYEDGTLAPPPTPGAGVNVGGAYPSTAPASPVGGPPAITPPPAPGGPLPGGGPVPVAAGVPPVGGGMADPLAAAGPPAITPPPPISIGTTPPPPDVGGVASTEPGTPNFSVQTGPDRGPSMGLGLDGRPPSDFFEPEVVEGPGSFDPFAFATEQNRRSLAPAIRGPEDPGGYREGDVDGSDPRKLIPRRRRHTSNATSDMDSGRLGSPRTIGRAYQSRPKRRP